MGFNNSLQYHLLGDIHVFEIYYEKLHFRVHSNLKYKFSMRSVHLGLGEIIQFKFEVLTENFSFSGDVVNHQTEV